jgi:hypothetical protein
MIGNVGTHTMWEGMAIRQVQSPRIAPEAASKTAPAPDCAKKVHLGGCAPAPTPLIARLTPAERRFFQGKSTHSGATHERA